MCGDEKVLDMNFEVLRDFGGVSDIKAGQICEVTKKKDD